MTWRHWYILTWVMILLVLWGMYEGRIQMRVCKFPECNPATGQLLEHGE